MSIKTTTTTEVTLDSINLIITPSTDLVASNSNRNVDVSEPQEVVAIKKEYSVIGDAFYAGVNSDAAPTWLTNLVNAVVTASVANGLTDYDSLVQDVRNAIDSIGVAANTYVEQIGFAALVDGIIGTHLTTLNASIDGKFATIVDLGIVKVDSESALALKASDLQAEFTRGIDSRITDVQTAYASADSALADSIESLTVSFTDQESSLSGNAAAISGLQNYVGLDGSSSNPNGLGMLARIGTLEKQTDGVVEYTMDTYDVMLGIEDPNNDTDNDQLDVTKEPYASWISADTASGTDDIRAAHTGDVYIMYSLGANGARTYIRSYKFIKSTPDATSPYSTDTEGYGWAIVSDTDSQAIYVIALQAKDTADGKISHFYAWGDMTNGDAPANYDVVVKEAEYLLDEDGNYLNVNGDIAAVPADYIEVTAAVTETVLATNVVLWFTGGALYKKGDSWAVKTLVPTVSGNGSFISEGDLLTVFDPIEGDTSVYWYSNGSWLTNGPTGIVSQSKWFVDLDNSVRGPHGHVAKSINELKVTSKAYANEKSLGVENKFSYDSKIYLDGKYYNSGFGLDSAGVTQVVDGLTEETAFDSEFWVNAKRFVLKNPDFPAVQATFNVTDTGITLGLENTEATKNEVKGEHVESSTYDKGDIVSSGGSSYAAKIDVPENTLISNTTYWMVLAEKGEPGVPVTGSRGSANLTYVVDAGNFSAATMALSHQDSLTNYWGLASGNSTTLSTKVEGDTLILSNVNLDVNGMWVHIFSWKGSAWSAIVVQRFAGSVIVDGTLLGNALSSSTSIIAGLDPETSATMSGSDDVFRFWCGAALGVDADYSVDKEGSVVSKKSFSCNKPDYSSPTPGFWVGRDADDKTKLSIGDINSFIRWDGDRLTVKGDIAFGSYVASDAVILSALIEREGPGRFSTEQKNHVKVKSFNITTGGSLRLVFDCRLGVNPTDNVTVVGEYLVKIDGITAYTGTIFNDAYSTKSLDVSLGEYSSSVELWIVGGDVEYVDEQSDPASTLAYVKNVYLKGDRTSGEGVALD